MGSAGRTGGVAASRQSAAIFAAFLSFEIGGFLPKAATVSCLKFYLPGGIRPVSVGANEVKEPRRMIRQPLTVAELDGLVADVQKLSRNLWAGS